MDLTGGFDVTLALNTAVNCGDNIASVVAECSDHACSTPLTNFPLECCRVGLAWVRGEIRPGDLMATSVSVAGLAFGCAGDMVTITTSVTAGQTDATVDPVTGAFGVTLPTVTALPCDTPIDVTVTCKADPYCEPVKVRGVRLDCPQCLRATLTATSAGPCVNGQEPITLGGTVMLPGPGPVNLMWDFGDGTTGPVFALGNPGGTATTPYPNAPNGSTAWDAGVTGKVT